jgi:hypothetical protein
VDDCVVTRMSYVFRRACGVSNRETSCYARRTIGVEVRSHGKSVSLKELGLSQ